MYYLNKKARDGGRRWGEGGKEGEREGKGRKEAKNVGELMCKLKFHLPGGKWMPPEGQEVSLGTHVKQKYVIVTLLFQAQKFQINHDLEKVHASVLRYLC